MKRRSKFVEIYGIHHPETHVCYYVGRTTEGAEKRFGYHQNFPTNPRLRVIFQDLEAQRLDPYVNVWESFWGGLGKAKAREKIWIRRFERANHPICNIQECEKNKKVEKLISLPLDWSEYRILRDWARREEKPFTEFIKGKLMEAASH